jgi:hypothetical protein
MRLSTVIASTLLVVPMLASAQGGAMHPQCAAATTQTRDACQKAADIFAYMAPQLSGALASNPVTPVGNFLPLTFSVGAVEGYIPDFNSVGTSTAGAQRSDYAVEKKPVPMPAVTGNLTLFKGVSTPFGRVGGLSGIITATFFPDIDVGDFKLNTVGGGVGLGYGAQFRAVDEGTFRPEISIAGVLRKTPRVRLLALTSAGDSVRADSMQVKTRTIRIEASKHLGWVGLVVGAGQDEYDSRGVASGSVATPLGVVESPVLSLAQTVSRTNVYAGVTLGIFRATVGKVSGGDVPATYNSFTERDGTVVTVGGTPRPAGQEYRTGSFSITLNF